MPRAKELRSCVQLISDACKSQIQAGLLAVSLHFTKCSYRGGPLRCTRFRRVFRSRKWAREIGQKPGEDVVWQRNAGRRQPPPQAHFISPNPPRHSRKSVSDGVIQLRVPLAGCAGFFLQAPIPRRILTKMSEAICCMNMRFAKRSWEHPCFSKSASRHSVVRVVGLGNSKLCEFPQRGACTISV